MVEYTEAGRPPGWHPKDAKLVQLRDGRKRPATSTGHLAGVVASDFVPLGQNVGIVLDGLFVAVDIDRPAEANEYLAKLPPTWTQATPRGSHRLYRVPAGFEGTNALLGRAGDIKTKGYIVGPGSTIKPEGDHPGGTYALQDARDPVEAPEWLLDLCRDRSSRTQAAAVTSEPPRDMIVVGERDNEMAKLAGYLKRRNFSEDASLAIIAAVVESGIVEQRPGNSMVADDVARLAWTALRWQPGDTPDRLRILPNDWETDEDVSESTEPIEWILPGFIPAVGLSILYGDGKIGKSSWASWLAAHVAKSTGKNTIFISSGEETFEQFVQRARHNGLPPGSILKYPAPESFVLPGSVPALLQAIKAIGNVGLVYIDALYSHFAESPGQNMAERARTRLRDLAEAAISEQVAVLGLIHENAGGGMLGAREMRNVCRSLIRGVRKKGGEFTIYGKGANGFQADYGVTFPGKAVPLLDAYGKQRIFTDLFGEDIPQAMWVLELGEKTHIADDEPEEIEVKDLIPKKEKVERNKMF